MRRLSDDLSIVAAFVVAGAGLLAAESATAAVQKTPVAPPVAVASPACLGGVLNDRDAGNYLTSADYPGFAALTAGLRRFFICGDSIPPILPSSQRAGFVSRRH